MTEGKSSLNILAILFAIALAGLSAYLFNQNDKLEREMEEVSAKKEAEIIALKADLNMAKTNAKANNINEKKNDVNLSVEKVENIPQDLNLFRAKPDSCVMHGKDCKSFNFINMVNLVNGEGKKQSYFIAFEKEGEKTRIYLAPVKFSPEAISKGSSLSMPNVRSFLLPMNLL